MPRLQWPLRVSDYIRGLSKEAATALRNQGVRLEAGDLADWLNQYSPKAAKGLLTGAVNLTRPFTRGLGVRVTEFDDEKIELTLPMRADLEIPGSPIHEGTYYLIASEALRLMWEKSVSAAQIQIQRYECEVYRASRGEIRCRLELLLTDRERLTFEAHSQGVAKASSLAQIIGEGGQLLAQVQMEYQVREAPLLG